MGEMGKSVRTASKLYNPHMPNFDPKKHHRRSIRLKEFDYASAGRYFVTIVAWRRECQFGKIVVYFKYQSTKEMNLLDNTGTVTKFWQRNYYEHIIRNEKDLQNKTDYINANPLLWDEDVENPINNL